MGLFNRETQPASHRPGPISLVHAVKSAAQTFDGKGPVRVWIDGVLVGRVADRFIILDEPDLYSRYRSMLCLPHEQLRREPLVARFKGHSPLERHVCELVMDESRIPGNLKVFIAGLDAGYIEGEIGRVINRLIRLVAQQDHCHTVDRLVAASSVTVHEGYRKLGFLGMNVADDQPSVFLELATPDGISGSWSIGSTEP